MEIRPRIWLDGEQIPLLKLPDVFRLAPTIPEVFSRSALITGGRGVGKTTLLRYQKTLHDGASAYISLTKEFASISQQTGYGPLTLASDYSPEVYRRIARKALALLGIEITHQLTKARDFKIPMSSLRNCLPNVLKGTELTREWLERARDEISSLALVEFEPTVTHNLLASLLADLSDDAATGGSPLLILLDRADMVATPCLTPIFELLDQVEKYIVLAAMRPTHGPLVSTSAIAGDHFDIFHIGNRPRSTEWVKFVESSIEAQMQLLDRSAQLAQVDVGTRARIFTLARDSIRVSLELFNYAMLGQRGSNLNAAITTVRDSLMAGAESSLQRYHSDFDGFVRTVRTIAQKEYGAINGPIVFRVLPRAPESLFDPGEPRLQRFIDAALRCNGLCVPSGHAWTPGGSPHTLECPPILAWEPSDPEWTWKDARDLAIDLRQDRILRAGYGNVKDPSVFVIYRMRTTESESFRFVLESAITHSELLPNVSVSDGRVTAGLHWPAEIRSRLTRSRLAVADVTGMRPDVMFELGFAKGLNRPAVPVVIGQTSITELPKWMSSIQTATYKKPQDIGTVVGSIVRFLSDPEANKANKLPDPVPGLLVWLRRDEWNHHSCDQFEAFCRRNGFQYEVYGNNLSDDATIRKVVRANLLVATFDGTERDIIANFVCGAVVAKPSAGTGRSLRRRVVVVEEPIQRSRGVVADSLLHCTDIVRMATPGEVLSHLNEFHSEYRAWLARPLRSRKRKTSKRG